MPVPHQIITASNVIGQNPPPPTPKNRQTHGWNVVTACTICEVQCVQMTLGGKSSPDDDHGIIRKATSLGTHAPMQYITVQVHRRTVFCSLCCCLFNEWLYMTLDQSGFVTTLNKQSPWDPQHLKYVHINAVLYCTCIFCFGDNGLK